MLPAGLQQHHRTDRKRHRHAGEKAANAVVVPDPTTLEVRKLKLALIRPREQVEERGLGAVKARADHRKISLISLSQHQDPYASCIWFSVWAIVGGRGIDIREETGAARERGEGEQRERFSHWASLPQW